MLYLSGIAAGIGQFRVLLGGFSVRSDAECQAKPLLQPLHTVVRAGESEPIR